MLTPFRSTGSPLSLVIGSLYIKHPNLFGGSEKLDVSLDKGLYDSNVLIAYRRPRPEWLAQQSFVIQHSIAPEIGVHGVPMDNFSRSGSGGVNLSRLADGLDLNEPASTKWSSTTSIKFEANGAHKELYEKGKEIQDLTQEVLGLKQALKDANDQSVLLFNEVQKAWKVSLTLQSDLKSENIMLVDKLKIEKEQNAQLRNQVAQLLQLEQDQKMQIQQRDLTIQTLQEIQH
ncbi:outer envelope protein 39, chloroplastic-like [Castanea sativa]|uniref:outer envelope protein 39, chloroplastic-like n=1 Tax=Castanea sativa TaxID=21020 RepID=UPI003F64C790